MRRNCALQILFALPAIALGGCGSEPCVSTAVGISEVYIESAIGYVARDIKTVEGNGYIIAGFSAVDGTAPYEDALVVKTDVAGAVQWARSYGDQGTGVLEEARSVHMSGDGGYIVAGNSGGPVWEPGALFQLPIDILLFKIDGAGNELWSQTVTVNRYTIAYSACANADGTFVVAGSAGEHLPGDEGALLIKMDQDGNELWRQQSTASTALTARDVIPTSGGGYAIAGYSEQSSGVPRKWDLYVATFDADGNEVWRFLGGEALNVRGDRIGEGIVQTRDGGYAVIATAYIGNAGELFVAKFSREGELVWVTAATGETHSEGHALLEAVDGSLVAVGGSYSLNPFRGCDSFFAARFSEAGALRWTGTFDRRSAEIAYALTESATGDFVLAGGRTSFAELAMIHLVTTDAGG